MKITGADVTKLSDLVVALLTNAELTMLVAGLNDKLERISEPGNLQNVAFQAITAANNEGWIDKFLDAFRRKRPNDPDLGRFVASLTIVAPAVVLDHYAVCFADNRPFVNRIPLRQTLRILTMGGPRILVVRGEPRSGKTYTSNLIKYLARQFGFELVRIDLVRYAAGQDVSPVDLGTAIASQMGFAGAPAPGNEQLARWTVAYFDWFVGQLRSSAAQAKTWWVVIDGFQSVSVPLAVDDFVDEFCARVDEALLSVRVVLISYERDLPVEMAPIVTEDKTAPITVDDLTSFFLKFYSEHLPAVTDREDRASTHAVDIALKMEAADAPLDVMGKELALQIRKIRQENH
ncbi:MAG: hypothetical protein DMF56_25975 [Acidobacteria bacterium]|nr:MAG: hypothetical protein DMF56_25975 [Acidobacteriota bacterium]